MPNATDLALSKSDVEKLAKLSRLLINVIAGILALAFAFLVLKQTEVISFLDQADVGLFYKTGLAIYYSAWVFGTKFDVDIEERVYIKDTARGVLDWKAFGIIIIFTIVMLIFFWLHQNERAFAFGLVGFILVNIAAWHVVYWRIGFPIRDSIDAYVGMSDYFGAEKVRLVDEYMRGNWQKARFAVMMAMSILLVALIHAILYFHMVEKYGAMTVMGIPAGPLIERAPAIFFLVYVAVAEGWMWIQRINVYHCVNVMDQLAARFRLLPKT